ncbi:hypothetical protein [Kordiimonas sp.]|uniref:hypothetical protein n=1 Tax=Kordiimonas sp. TaxID=1970157 RepID=UPI003A8F6D91
MRHEILAPARTKRLHGITSRGSCLVVVGPPTRYPVTDKLPRGTQARMMNAAVFSEKIGYPLNTHTIINAAQLQRIGAGGVFGIGHLWDGFQELMQLMRKWHTGRGLPWVMIASREYNSTRAKHPCEHWHIAHHQPRELRSDWTAQLPVWTEEGTSAADDSISEHNAWRVTSRWPGGRGPDNLAAYLGKAEPGRIKLHGKWQENTLKPRPDKYGGEGPVEGKRFRISRSIDRAAQAKAGFAGPYPLTRHEASPSGPHSAPYEAGA